MPLLLHVWALLTNLLLLIIIIIIILILILILILIIIIILLILILILILFPYLPLSSCNKDVDSEKSKIPAVAQLLRGRQIAPLNLWLLKSSQILFTSRKSSNRFNQSLGPTHRKDLISFMQIGKDLLLFETILPPG